MYGAFYGLKEMPFRITPDPRFLYPSARHREAVDSLVYGIVQRAGFMVLVGDVGSGKTTVCRCVMAALPADVETALILNPGLNGNQMVRAMLHDLGQTPRGRDRLALLEQLNAHLLRCAGEGRTVAVFIDEAQGMAADTMEQVRLLSNLETDESKLLQIVLSGQPELTSRLASKGLRQLRQRVMVHSELAPLTLDESRAYVEHRLRVAGREETGLFDERALRALHQGSGGVPRLLNKLCDRALLAGYANGRAEIGMAEANRALRELEAVR
jgi:general secretion pathway protein A